MCSGCIQAIQGHLEAIALGLPVSGTEHVVAQMYLDSDSGA